MINLIIDNSESKLEGLLINDHKALKEILSYTLSPTASYFSGGYGPRKQSLLSTRGVFPTGLLYLVLDYIQKNNVPHKVTDKRIVPKRQEGLFKLVSPQSPYPEQVAAAKQAIRAERGIVVAPTGCGKSFILALMIEQVQVPTLVIVPSLELKRQLSETLGALFGKDTVGVNKPIYVENVDSLRSKKGIKAYDAVIIDEFHHSGAKTYRKLNKTLLSKTFYKWGLTATPFRSQNNERLLLESVLSKVIASIKYEDAVRNGYIVPMEAYYIELPKQKTLKTTWAGVYSELVVNNQARNNIISSLLESLDSQSKSTLCLVKEIAHGETLAKSSNLWFANGESEDTPGLISLFNSGKLKTLIGTTGIIGEGIDTKPAEFVIIAGLGKSKNAFHQQIGRGFRIYPGKESCKIIIFKDRSHKFTLRHFKAQCSYLLEDFGIVPVKLNIE